MKKIVLAFLISILALPCLAQENKTPEEKEKEFYEAIQNQIDRMAEQLNLEDWQVFYVDSIYTHDYKAMQDEFAALSAAKVANSDLFYDVQDKWMEQIYQSMHKVLDEKQWAQYEKLGAARDKRAREKRAAKKNNKAGKK